MLTDRVVSNHADTKQDVRNGSDVSTRTPRHAHTKCCYGLLNTTIGLLAMIGCAASQHNFGDELIPSFEI